MYVAEVLLRCSTESCKAVPKMEPRPPPPDDKGEMQVTHINMLTFSVSLPVYR